MMDERERRGIMLRAIHRYGEAAQIDMAVEEMAELTKALCKVKRATPGATTTAAIANVIEEIADVQIMLDQLRLIFARSTEEVEEDKLRRLLGRLNDFFGGSGTTLAACEAYGQPSYTMELTPAFTDVIVKRYIRITGKQNVRCVRQGRELSREEIAEIFGHDEEGGGQE